MAKRKPTNEQIQEVIKGIKLGYPKDIKQMLLWFSPLIRKTCATLYHRYNGLVSMNDLLLNGNHLLIYLCCMEYTPDGGAYFPQFAKTYLHARLVQYCRPILAYRKRATELKEYIPDEHLPMAPIYKTEREAITEKLNDFMWKNLNERELDLVVNHMIKGISRNKLAAHYGVSKIRMKVIHKKCQLKLQEFLEKFNIRSIRDI